VTPRTAIVAGAMLFAAGIACGGRVPPPSTLDTRNDTCSLCRMIVSDRRLASQIVVRGEEPKFFDDLGCLAKFLEEHQLPDAAVFVADHRTGEWTPATGAVYSRVARTTTPMASGLIAHATSDSRSQDAGAAGSMPVDADVVFGRRSPDGRREP
jgi:copper chaperone NosL